MLKGYRDAYHSYRAKYEHQKGWMEKTGTYLWNRKGV